MIGGNTIVPYSDVYPVKHTYSTGSNSYSSTSPDESTVFSNYATQDRQAVEGFVGVPDQETYNEPHRNYNGHTWYVGTRRLVGNLDEVVEGYQWFDGITLKEYHNIIQYRTREGFLDPGANGEFTFPGTPFTDETVFGPTTYVAHGTSFESYDKVYTDTDTYTDTSTYTGIRVSSDTDGVSNTYTTDDFTKNITTTSSARITDTDATRMIPTAWNSFYTLWQTTIPVSWAEDDERLAFRLPVEGYEEDLVDYTDAYSDLGTRINAGTGFPAEGANFVTSVYDTETQLRTALKTTTLESVSFVASATTAHTITVGSTATASGSMESTRQDSSVDSEGLLHVYSETYDHNYTYTVNSDVEIPVTITGTVDTTVSDTDGYHTYPISLVGNESHALSGGVYTFVDVGHDLSYASTYLGSVNSVDSVELQHTAATKSISYTSTSTDVVIFHGGSTYEVTDSFYSDGTFEERANSTVTEPSYCPPNLKTANWELLDAKTTQLFGLGKTYQTAGMVLTSPDMGWDNGWGIGLSVPANISYVSFGGSMVNDGIYMVTTLPRDLVKVSQSENSITATTYGTENVTVGTLATTSTNDSLTTSNSNTTNTEISWTATHYTNNLQLGEEVSFVNDGWSDVTAHMRGRFRITTFNSAGGDLSRATGSISNDYASTLADGVGLVAYTAGSKGYVLKYTTVRDTFREIATFKKT